MYVVKLSVKILINANEKNYNILFGEYTSNEVCAKIAQNEIIFHLSASTGGGGYNFK